MSASDAASVRVACPACHKTYRLSLERLKGKTRTLRCAACNHRFPLPSPDSVREDRPALQLRRRDGTVTPVGGLPQLKRLIIEGAVSPEDSLSRSGSAWKRLADIPELESHFRVARLTSGAFEPVSPPAKQKGAKLDPAAQSTAPASAPAPSAVRPPAPDTATDAATDAEAERDEDAVATGPSAELLDEEHGPPELSAARASEEAGDDEPDDEASGEAESEDAADGEALDDDDGDSLLALAEASATASAERHHDVDDEDGDENGDDDLDDELDDRIADTAERDALLASIGDHAGETEVGRIEGADLAQTAAASVSEPAVSGSRWATYTVVALFVAATVVLILMLTGTL